MAFAKKTDEIAVVKPANIQCIVVRIRGTAPYVQNKFSHKARQKMMADMATPANKRKSKFARPPRDYNEDFYQAQYISTTGWLGIPAPAFRAAMIDACRTVNMVMTRAKMSIFVLPDGFDITDGTPLVKLIAAPPERHEGLVRNDNGGADIRIRPMWREWECDVTIEFDADMITSDSVVNLLDRAGRQVGVGEGRPYSKDSVGQGWGTFMVGNTVKGAESNE